MVTVVKVYPEKHTTTRALGWPCAVCRYTIFKGEPYRLVQVEGRRTLFYAHVKCTDELLREQFARDWSNLTGKTLEESRKIVESVGEG